MNYGLDATFRPISTWPGGMTRNRNRKRSRFDSSWSSTLALLKAELRHLGARSIVIELALTESEIRRDGYPRAQAQGLPPDFLVDAPFTLTGKCKVVGNGVPLPLGLAVAKAVKRALHASDVSPAESQ